MKFWENNIHQKACANFAPKISFIESQVFHSCMSCRFLVNSWSMNLQTSDLIRSKIVNELTWSTYSWKLKDSKQFLLSKVKNDEIY